MSFAGFAPAQGTVAPGSSPTFGTVTVDELIVDAANADVVIHRYAANFLAVTADGSTLSTGTLSAGNIVASGNYLGAGGNYGNMRVSSNAMELRSGIQLQWAAGADAKGAKDLHAYRSAASTLTVDSDGAGGSATLKVDTVDVASFDFNGGSVGGLNANALFVDAARAFQIGADTFISRDSAGAVRVGATMGSNSGELVASKFTHSTGLFRQEGGSVGVGSAEVLGWASAAAVSAGLGNLDTLLSRDAESALALKGDGDAAPQIRVYDSDASNYAQIRHSGTQAIFSTDGNASYYFRAGAGDVTLFANGQARLAINATGATFNSDVLLNTGTLSAVDRATDPSDPANGSYTIWQSDGTGSGDDGDIMLKITDSGGTTKTITLVDFSAF